MANSQFDERTLSADSYSLLVADGTTKQTIASYANNHRYDTLVLANYDSIPHAYVVEVTPQSADAVAIGSGTLPAVSSGVVSAVEVLHSALPAGAQFLVLPSGAGVSVRLAVAVTGDNLFAALLLGGSI
jgi:hypothetical protein